jgi:hypothetical protein
MRLRERLLQNCCRKEKTQMTVAKYVLTLAPWIDSTCFEALQGTKVSTA